jgi:hypothetical protein
METAVRLRWESGHDLLRGSQLVHLAQEALLKHSIRVDGLVFHGAVFGLSGGFIARSRASKRMRSGCRLSGVLLNAFSKLILRDHLPGRLIELKFHGIFCVRHLCMYIVGTAAVDGCSVFEGPTV